MSTIGIGNGTLHIGSANAVSSLRDTQSSSNTNASAVLDSLTGNSGSGDAATTDISKGAQFASKLQQLKTSDPAKYKATLTEAASHLRDAAKSETGDAGKFLNTLADKFDKAAGGDDSALQPPDPSKFAGKGGTPPSAIYANKGDSSSTDSLLSNLSSSGKAKHNHPQISGQTKKTLDAVFSLFDDAAKSSSTTTKTSTASTSSTTKTSEASA